MKLFTTILCIPLALAAPVLDPTSTDIIQDEFIIVYKKDSDPNEALSAITSKLGGVSPQTVYEIGSFRGCAVKASPDIISAIASISAIDYIQPNTVVKTNTVRSESDAPYNLARVSHKTPVGSNYIFDDSAGRGTTAYVIDTGIYTNHPQFDGRASWGANFVGDGLDSDGNGHGTHVAGTIGSMDYGVSRNANLIAVKVLDSTGSGSTANVMKGVQWVLADAIANKRVEKSVANMSLGAMKILPGKDALMDAIAKAVDAGIFFAVAAGNSNTDASLFTPASEPKACTVGATDSENVRAQFSNYNKFKKFVDIFAPGVEVVSTWNDGTTASLSGTSMATPHVAGVAAYFLGLKKYAPVELCGLLTKFASGRLQQDLVDVYRVGIVFNNATLPTM